MKRIVRKWLSNFVSLAIGLLYSSVLTAQIAGYQNDAVDIGAGFDGVVNAVAFQSDGKILVGGALTSYKGIPCGNLVRLNTDGTLDESFLFPAKIGGEPTSQAFYGTINSILVESDDKILLVGSIRYDWIPETDTELFVGVTRLNADGSLDTDYLNG